MTNKNEEKWFKDTLDKVEWPDVPVGLHEKAISFVDKSESKIVFFFPLRQISKWALVAFSISFCFGMLQENPETAGADIITEAPYYGMTSIYIMQTVGENS